VVAVIVEMDEPEETEVLDVIEDVCDMVLVAVVGSGTFLVLA
jgi:hypothetical protein